MARARLNWLDIHGTWDISLTSAPNLYAYFVQCPSFPSVGVPPEIKKANLARLNKVIDLAREHQALSLLGNHELAELVGFPIQKNHRILNLVFRIGLEQRYGAEGEGPSIYLRDPEGNMLELKGPPGG